MAIQSINICGMNPNNPQYILPQATQHVATSSTAPQNQQVDIVQDIKDKKTTILNHILSREPKTIAQTGDFTTSEWETLLSKLKKGEQSLQNLLNSPIPFESRDIQVDFGQLCKHFKDLEDYARFHGTPFVGLHSDLYREITSLSNNIKELPRKLIEADAKKFFSTLYLNHLITYSTKINGRQIGKIIDIQDKTTKAITKYYIKTHSNGWHKTDNSSGLTTIDSGIPKSINSHELLVYKILHKLGVGPKSHFFGRNERCIFIATEDANRNNTFELYRKFQEMNILQFQSPIELKTEEILISISEDEYSTYTATENQASIFETEDIKKIMKKMTELDLMARFFRLKDVYNNGGNFGFDGEINNQDNPLLLNIIDFNMADTDKLFYGDFDNFIIGNGLFKTEFSDTFRSYVFKYRDLRLRLQDVLDVFNSGIFQGLDTKLNTALTEVSNDFHSCNINEPLKSALINNMKLYNKNVLSNMDRFQKYLDKFVSSYYIKDDSTGNTKLTPIYRITSLN